jgi:hypothetical protein
VLAGFGATGDVGRKKKGAEGVGNRSDNAEYVQQSSSLQGCSMGCLSLACIKLREHT